MKRNNLQFGKPKLESIHIQALAILSARHAGIVEIHGIRPQRKRCGNFALVEFTTSNRPDFNRSRLFATLRVGPNIDVWLEGPVEIGDDNHNDNDAA